MTADGFKFFFCPLLSCRISGFGTENVAWQFNYYYAKWGPSSTDHEMSQIFNLGTVQLSY